ncbi:MAG: GGDEF domain-containing protein [Parcubacteria group bacterium]
MEARGTEKPIVLLVDDEGEYSDMFLEVFLVAGYQVEIACSFENVLEIIHEHERRNFVVFVDINSPKVHAKQALMTYIRNEVPGRVVSYAWIFATAEEKDNLKQESLALRMGARRAFFKGVDSIDLLLVYTQEYQGFLRFFKTAEEDFMTGLKNLRGFTRDVEGELRMARDRGQPEIFSLIMIDVDYFKVVNDTYGHQVGDEALKAISQIITEHVRFSDRSCRYGGDEFLIFLSNLGTEKAREVGKKIQKAVKARPVIDQAGVSVDLSVSIGVGEMRKDEVGDNVEKSFKELVVRAEMGESGLQASRRHRR